MTNELFQEVKRIISEDWVVKGENSDESSNRVDLIECLKSELVVNNKINHCIEKKLEKEEKLQREMFYIDVEGKIIVSIIKDLFSDSQIDTSLKHMLQYFKHAKHIIVVLIGETDKKMVKVLENRINGLCKEKRHSDCNFDIIDKGMDYLPRKKSPIGMGMTSQGSSYYG